MNISGKTVLITGASSGIGAAIAKAMCQEGAGQILLLARNEDGLRETAQAVERDSCKALIYTVNLADGAEVEAVSKRILDEVGVPDILINNAGVGQWRFLTESTTDDIVQSMAVPYLAAAWLTRMFLPGMLRRNSGQIINISSVASRMAWPGATAYIAACRAMRGLSDALRADLSGTGIGVSHYESGPIDSPYWRNNPGSRERIPGIAKLLLPVLTQSQVAQAIVQGVLGNRRFIVTPINLRLVYRLHAVFPWAVQWLMIATGYSRSR